ncbi:MAG TPA: CDC27 family protein [Gammaproteobacteria bacterium]|nr:CDC27 family protein [Gammaproteobacteria bacterium]
MNRTFFAAAIAGVLVLAGANPPAQAAQSGQNRNVKALDQYTAAKLQNAQKELKDKKYAEALSDLQDLANDVKDKPYALALTERMIAYVYIEQKEYKKALPYFQKAVDLKSLPDQQQHQALMALAQLYVATEQYRNAIGVLEKWFAEERKAQQKPDADAYILAAQAYYQVKDLKKARYYAKKAIAESDEPQQGWYTLLVGVDYRLKNFDEAVDLLKKMISYWPDKAEYWHNLYGIYLQQDKETDALSVMRLAYSKGMMDDEGDLLNLARLEITHDMPYYAGEVISKGMKDNKIKTNIDNLRLLVTAWTSAQETDKALDTLDQAAKLSKDGQLYLKKAQLCYVQTDWDCTVKAADDALAKGGLDKPGNAYIFKGEALMQNKKYDKAEAAFVKAERYDESKTTARQWLDYLRRLRSTS